MLHLATYFDKNYLNRGLVLYDSLKQHTTDFELYILSLDDFTFEYFQQLNYPEIKLLKAEELETADAELRHARQNRSVIEYYFTLSPCLPLYLLKKFSLPHICTLDADILFLSDPAPLFEYLEQYSIIITPHKFSEEMKKLERFGKYNVSFQVFKNDSSGLACLEKWRSQCIEWCGDVFDEKNNRFADQKYLDEWMTLYPGKVKELYDNVSGLAPWNLNHYRVTQEGGNFYSNGERIIFYHFHHFKLLSAKWASNGLKNYRAKDQQAIKELYLYYWNSLEDKNEWLGFEKDKSQRSDLSGQLPQKLLKELCVFYKPSRKKLVQLNLCRMPNIAKRILLKIYA